MLDGAECALLCLVSGSNTGACLYGPGFGKSATAHALQDRGMCACAPNASSCPSRRTG